MPSQQKTSHIKEKALEELRLFWAIFVFLALMFGGFTWYRRLILSEVGVSYGHYGIALIEAAVIAKVILIGRAIKLGKRIEDRPLIMSVLVKAALYGLFVALFDVVERVVEGLLHRESWHAIGHRVVPNGRDEMLAQTLLVMVTFIPFFAIGEIGRVLGVRKLFELFFQRRPA
jgi:hypothetical protein